MKKIVTLVIVLALMFSTFTLAIDAVTVNPTPVEKETVKIEAIKIEKNEKDSSIKIIYPVFSGFNLASKLNDKIQNININSIGYIRDAWYNLLQMKEEQKAAGQEISNLEVALDKTFDYSINGNVLSVMLNTYSYAGGAHGNYDIESFTANTKTSEIYTFNSLFNQKSNYRKFILDKINKMIDKEKELYFEDAKKTVAERKTEDFQFYLDGSNLVVYFGLYDLRPYAGGMSMFTIAAKELKGFLKDEIYSQIINAKPLTKMRLNGTSFTVPYKLFEQNYSTMVPLKYFAETLGYKVGWDSKKGALVAGGYIKNNVNSYYTDKTKKTPVKLFAAPKTVDNQLFVPVEYFSQVLKEDVSYDGDIVRLYKYDTKDKSQFSSQIIDFRLPTSAEEGVKMYAQAVKERKGAIQYALYSEKLRAATKSKFEEINWVTGVSSPWVTSYDIKNISKGTYSIVFHWATSSGKAPDSKTVVTIENMEFGILADYRYPRVVYTLQTGAIVTSCIL